MDIVVGAGKRSMDGNPAVLSVFAIVALAAALGIAGPRLTPAPAGGYQPSALAVAASPLRLASDIEIVMYQGQTEVGGEKIALSALWEKRHQPVVLNFWAGLCPPCRAEMPDFQRLFEQPGRKFVLIGVDIGPFVGLGSRDDGKSLLRALKLTYPAGTTFDIRTIRNYEVLGMPTTVFITSDGRILRKYTGLLAFEQMKMFADELVRGSPSH